MRSARRIAAYGIFCFIWIGWEESKGKIYGWAAGFRKTIVRKRQQLNMHEDLNNDDDYENSELKERWRTIPYREWCGSCALKELETDAIWVRPIPDGLFENFPDDPNSPYCLAEFKNVQKVKQAIRHHLYFTLRKTQNNTTINDYYLGLAYTVRDYLVKQWIQTTKQDNFNTNKKTLYFLSIEFCMGKQLKMMMINLGIEDDIYQASHLVSHFNSHAVAVRILRIMSWHFYDKLFDIEKYAYGFDETGYTAGYIIQSLANMNISTMSYGLRFDHGTGNHKVDNVTSSA
ncbi:unnamed protein product [Didymodactylos carnosus]|uniref:Glycogen phosphorylase, liver form n=1 Tax=Didymodactylos carnosus TaxID=1234261 RepID=A0A8S2DBL0_9BILA|nr:unnamed protein product [Didymodactylos carnosus]CAF3705007.1 unnamed protein product [Didymodactylos carnosus]